MVLMMVIGRLQREQGHCLENDNVLMMMVMMIMVVMGMMRMKMVLMMVRMIVRLEREQGHTGPDKLVQRAFVSTTGRRHLSTMQCNEQIHTNASCPQCIVIPCDAISQCNVQFFYPQIDTSGRLHFYTLQYNEPPNATCAQ